MNITTSLEKLMEEVGLGQVGRWGHFSIYHKFKPPQICYKGVAEGGQLCLKINNTPLFS